MISGKETRPRSKVQGDTCEALLLRVETSVSGKKYWGGKGGDEGHVSIYASNSGLQDT